MPRRVSELRMRVGRPMYCYDGVSWFFIKDGKSDLIVTGSDIDCVIGRASGYSVYAVTDNVVKGYLMWKGGIRIGIVGEGVTDGDTLTGIKKISALNIRVPTEIKGQANSVIGKIINGGELRSALIISPTGAGKTTLLREIARKVSEFGKNVAIIDERYELSAPFDGVPSLDVGKCTDILAGVNKTAAVQMLVRSMNPDMIVTDEVYGENEIDAVLDAMRAGVKIAASVHAENLADLEGTIYKRLSDRAEVIAVLQKIRRVGEIKEVIDRC